MSVFKKFREFLRKDNPTVSDYIVGYDSATMNEIRIPVSSLAIQGNDGDSLQVQYSADRVSWHFPFQESDLYMRQRLGVAAWSAPIKISVEDILATGSIIDKNERKNFEKLNDTLEGSLKGIDNALGGKENDINKVDISPKATSEQYPNAKSVWDLIQSVAVTIPASGLKIPISIELESKLPDVSTLEPGYYFFIQEMDETAPERTGRAWVNYTDPNDDTTPLKYYRVIDQYQSMDGVSIVQTPAGTWGVHKTWLTEQTAGKLDEITEVTVYNQIYYKTASGEQSMYNVSSGAIENTIAHRGANATLQVGYPTAAAHAATKQYVDEMLNNKLDKTTNSTSMNQVYIKTTTGSQQMYNMTATPTANTLVQRNSNGQISVTAPTQDDHAANKKYVDDSVLLKEYNIEVIKNVGKWNLSNKIGKLKISEDTELEVDNKMPGTFILAITNTVNKLIFSSDFKFPAGKVPTPSGNGTVDIYEFACIDNALHLINFTSDLK